MTYEEFVDLLVELCSFGRIFIFFATFLPAIYDNAGLTTVNLSFPIRIHHLQAEMEWSNSTNRGAGIV
jgi:hypothetical protein